MLNSFNILLPNNGEIRIDFKTNGLYHNADEAVKSARGQLNLYKVEAFMGPDNSYHLAYGTITKDQYESICLETKSLYAHRQAEFQEASYSMNLTRLRVLNEATCHPENKELEHYSSYVNENTERSQQAIIGSLTNLKHALVLFDKTKLVAEDSGYNPAYSLVFTPGIPDPVIPSHALRQAVIAASGIEGTLD